MQALQQIFAVALVFGLLFGCLYWLRRRGFAYGGRTVSKRAGALLQPIERVPLSPGHTLHLVRVGNRALVVAASPGGCRAIASLPWASVERSAQP